MYATIIGKGDEADRDWKVEAHENDSYTVTDMATGNSVQIQMNNFDFEHNSLIKMDLAGNERETIQFIG